MAKRIVLIAAAVLIVAGVALFVVTMATNGWDFSLLDYAKRETVTHAVQEDFSKIRIDTDCTNIPCKISVIKNIDHRSKLLVQILVLPLYTKNFSKLCSFSVP